MLFQVTAANHLSYHGPPATRILWSSSQPSEKLSEPKYNTNQTAAPVALALYSLIPLRMPRLLLVGYVLIIVESILTSPSQIHWLPVWWPSLGPDLRQVHNSRQWGCYGRSGTYWFSARSDHVMMLPSACTGDLPPTPLVRRRSTAVVPFHSSIMSLSLIRLDLAVGRKRMMEVDKIKWLALG